MLQTQRAERAAHGTPTELTTQRAAPIPHWNCGVAGWSLGDAEDSETWDPHSSSSDVESDESAQGPAPRHTAEQRSRSSDRGDSVYPRAHNDVESAYARALRIDSESEEEQLMLLGGGAWERAAAEADRAQPAVRCSKSYTSGSAAAAAPPALAAALR